VRPATVFAARPELPKQATAGGTGGLSSLAALADFGAPCAPDRTRTPHILRTILAQASSKQAVLAAIPVRNKAASSHISPSRRIRSVLADDEPEHTFQLQSPLLDKLAAVLAPPQQPQMQQQDQRLGPAQQIMQRFAKPMQQAVRPQPNQPQKPAGQVAQSPSLNPINTYGPLSMSGEVNGNAGFGVANSSIPSKLASMATQRLAVAQSRLRKPESRKQAARQADISIICRSSPGSGKRTSGETSGTGISASTSQTKIKKSATKTRSASDSSSQPSPAGTSLHPSATAERPASYRVAPWSEYGEDAWKAVESRQPLN